MADKVKIWYDAEGDFLEVRFNNSPGFMKASNHDSVMERVDLEGNVIGFSVIGVSQHKKEKPLEAELSR